MKAPSIYNSRKFRGFVNFRLSPCGLCHVLLFQVGERKNAQEIFPRNSSRDLSLKTAFVASHFVHHAACAAAGQPPCHLGKRRSAAWEGRKAHCFFESMPSDSSKTPLYSVFWMKILNSAHRMCYILIEGCLRACSDRRSHGFIVRRMSRLVKTEHAKLAQCTP